MVPRRKPGWENSSEPRERLPSRASHRESLPRGAAVFAVAGVIAGLIQLAAALWLRSLPRVADNLRQIGAATLGGQAGWRGQIQTTGRLPYAVAIAAGTGLQTWLAGNSAWPFK